jgi:glycosyltransferase involved in cell wall biosynthesis
MAVGTAPEYQGSFMKSVLFINYEYPPVGAGAANANYYFAVNMVQKGIKASVLTSACKSRRGRVVEEGVAVYRVPAFRRKAESSSILQMLLFTASALVHLPAVVHRERPDALVVFFSFPCGPVGLFAYLFWRIPYVLLLRGGDVPGSDARLHLFHGLLTHPRRMIYKRSIAVAANSEGLRHLALKSDPEFQIHVVRNGVDILFFRPSEQPMSDDGHFYFLFAGRFCVQKNIGMLIKAFSACLSRHPAIRLVLLGNGPHYPELKSLAESLVVDGNIKWAGWRSKNDTRAFYQSSHCLVNPSINEGMPNTVLEAMACGLPVLGSDCIGNRELIVNGENGFLFTPFNLDELRDRMIDLADDRQLCGMLGANGRRMCCERYTWTAVTDELCSLFHRNFTDR